MIEELTGSYSTGLLTLGIIWLARTIHRAPWETKKQRALESDEWDLYNVREDFSLTRNLAAKQPQRLRELQALFMEEAEKYHVLPIDDRTVVVDMWRGNPIPCFAMDDVGLRVTTRQAFNDD